jgi:hypothetical protein
VKKAQGEIRVGRFLCGNTSTPTMYKHEKCVNFVPVYIVSCTHTETPSLDWERCSLFSRPTNGGGYVRLGRVKLILYFTLCIHIELEYLFYYMNIVLYSILFLDVRQQGRKAHGWFSLRRYESPAPLCLHITFPWICALGACLPACLFHTLRLPTHTQPIYLPTHTFTHAQSVTVVPGTPGASPTPGDPLKPMPDEPAPDESPNRLPSSVCVLLPGLWCGEGESSGRGGGQAWRLGGGVGWLPLPLPRAWVGWGGEGRGGGSGGRGPWAERLAVMSFMGFRGASSQLSPARRASWTCWYR